MEHHISLCSEEQMKATEDVRFNMECRSCASSNPEEAGGVLQSVRKSSIQGTEYDVSPSFESTLDSEKLDTCRDIYKGFSVHPEEVCIHQKMDFVNVDPEKAFLENNAIGSENLGSIESEGVSGVTGKYSESYPHSRESSYIEIFPSEVSGCINMIKHNIKLQRTVPYNSLYQVERKNLRSFCLRRFQNQGIFILFLTCGAQNDAEHNQYSVDSGIFQVLNILKQECVREPNLFCKDGDIAMVFTCLNRIQLDLTLDMSKINLLTLGSTLKTYMSDTMKGILPVNIAGPLLDARKARNVKKVKRMLYFLPFVFSEDSRKLLIGLFFILRRIIPSDKSMLKHALSALLPSLFPDILLKNEVDFDNALNMAYMMFSLNYERVPIELLNKQ